MTAPFDWAGLFKHAFSVMRRETPGNRIAPAAELLRTRIEAAFVPVERCNHFATLAEARYHAGREATARAEAAEARNKVLADTLGSVPIPDRQEPARDFYERMNVWLQGPYAAASKALGGEHER
jgi:hypothetical protein